MMVSYADGRARVPGSLPTALAGGRSIRVEENDVLHLCVVAAHRNGNKYLRDHLRVPEMAPGPFPANCIHFSRLFPALARRRGQLPARAGWRRVWPVVVDAPVSVLTLPCRGDCVMPSMSSRTGTAGFPPV